MSKEKCKPMREKYWSELDDEGKVERMRGEVKHLKSQNKQLIESVRQLLTSVRQLLTHVHNKEGTALIPIDPAFGSQIHGYLSGPGGAANKDDVYF